MKKFIFICAILFIAGVGCKKMNIDGGALCGCSPISNGPDFKLVIKNEAGEDLLNEKTTGAYTKDKITFFRKDESGKKVPINFAIRPSFSYGDEKFDDYQLYTNDVFHFLKKDNKVAYLKLGDGKEYELSLELEEGKYTVSKLFIDQIEAEKATGNITNYAQIFYLTT
ncbi:hypothetical protein ACSBL2_19635 [Pedobacter sp. AW31-3R]|uniref:hypothetical protein n=1 Tax=Pedobacter sp. AW31-3R TaxID=3445781 RepID=UPI003F9F0D1F